MNHEKLETNIGLMAILIAVGVAMFFTPSNNNRHKD